ncbi:thiamine-phosphate kinase [Acidipila rosea]|uniref:Thiamine-monophosphate kinase n=1 Tax=Acidipila rosea TaxID=768535 RepID=A0A4R1L3J4_9BACT|nr:thiamine-phosphate kinase [Acidipila rosea]TCK72564.1 thiamine-phosphate kinase [Acidipila rosea]
MKKSSTLGELALIESIRRRPQRMNRAVRMGIGDDCALLRLRRGEELAVTTDFSLEGIHFRRDWHAPEQAGHRCLARGLSDLAAMGATPVAAFLSLAAPAELTRSTGRMKSWVGRFLDGLLALAAAHKVVLAGGDTACFSSVAADIVLTGSVRQGKALLRSTARAGDIVYVTGALGGAAAELLAVERDPRLSMRLIQAASGHPHLFPEPRLAVGRSLVTRGLATAGMDISDGLSTDLHHLCEESRLSAEIDAAAIPLHPLAAEAERSGHAASALALALHGGEDYELLFTASPKAKIPGKIAGVAIHPIGRMLRRGSGVQLRTGKTRTPLAPQGWEHFRR